MSQYGYHWTPCNRGGGGLAALLAVLAVIAVVVRKPVEHAADDVLRVAVDALEIAAITVASAAGLAVLGGMAYGAQRAYHWQATRRQAIPRQGQAGQAVSGPHRRAIAARRAPLYVITSEHRIEEEK
jgi:hypothetical protein